MGIVKKTEDALTGLKEGLSSNSSSDHTTNQGPHHSNVANKVDPRVDSTPGTQVRHEALGGTSEPYNTSVAHPNTAEPRLGNDLDNRHFREGQTGNTQFTTNQTQTTGPHNSELANKLDPRVGQPGNARFGTQDQPQIPPHKSNLANKLDPRVDTNTYNRPAESYDAGNFHQQAATGPYSTNPAHRTAEPHFESDMVDPRVSSGVQNRGTQPGHATTGNPQLTSTLGHGGSAPPGYDAPVTGHTQAPSSTDYTNPTSGSTAAYGANTAQGSYRATGPELGHGGYNEVPAGSSYNNPRSQTTAGPHDTNIGNKLDPRVDSDRSASQRTFT
ncbi:hypothetical protein N7468_001627 [Penicillium chermesinum]|uniref:Cell surface protein n=1 Tax=Penicillium chermesinum TaxID=63820 RepID=A0A9W9PH61_9EURO|nr:uncharacterized protein N7468_001627 [Penicillium chermesinum]KAJ5246644.1 hypothetical protein N7468_001627 [Penicillium chermesinum]KAJ6144916.1 hypothetical protein N7470_008811 [Penicillium chermesinum]